MKKIVSMLIALAMLGSLGAAMAEEAEQSGDASILIAYFSWADNAVIEDEQASIQSALDHYDDMGDTQSGVDATSSASLLPPGNTAVMAGYIQEIVGGDLFSIQVEEPYSSVYDECLDRASDELADNARPALRTHVENMEQYDIVFLGMPNWWYSCPMAVLTFVEEYDFSGKTVVPFVEHGTGGISGSVREPVGVYRPDIAACQPVIEEWLRSLDLPIELEAVEE